MAPSPWLVALLFGAGALVGVACTGPLPGDEDSGSGETTGDCPIGGLNCSCTQAGSCDPGLVCASKRCVPGAATEDTGDDTSTSDPTSGTTMAVSEETTAAECEPNGDGSPDPACPPDQPYCDAGSCVDCSAISCEAVSSELPVCDPNTGLCSACACDDSAPVCDPVMHTCSQCTAHGQCPDSACDLWTGACMPVAAALWVDQDGACDDAATGTADDPLCTLAEAFARVQADPDVAHAVRVRPAAYSVMSPLRVPEGGKVAVVHATGGAGDPAVQLAADGTALTVDPSGALLVDAIAIAGSGDDALTCDAGELWLDRLMVADTEGHGIATVGCGVLVRRSVLTGNVMSGAFVADGEAHVENTYISSNGNSLDGFGGVYLAGGASLVAVYTSFIDNIAVAGTPYSIACNENPDDPANEAVAVRNSVAINKGMNTLCGVATVTTTAWSSPAEAGVGNLKITFPEMSTYLMPDPELSGVYRAIKGTALDELAKWEAGDPDIDFDGDPRPSDDSSPDFAGADRVSQ